PPSRRRSPVRCAGAVRHAVCSARFSTPRVLTGASTSSSEARPERSAVTEHNSDTARKSQIRLDHSGPRASAPPSWGVLPGGPGRAPLRRAHGRGDVRGTTRDAELESVTCTDAVGTEGERIEIADGG